METVRAALRARGFDATPEDAAALWAWYCEEVYRTSWMEATPELAGQAADMIVREMAVEG